MNALQHNKVALQLDHKSAILNRAPGGGCSCMACKCSRDTPIISTLPFFRKCEVLRTVKLGEVERLSVQVTRDFGKDK